MNNNTMRAWCGLVALLASSAGSLASLQPSQVLVVYDSRNAEGRLIAEHYAGSALVPGGVGGKVGTRRGVRVMDLAAAGAAAMPGDGTVTPSFFESELRDPVRAHIEAEGQVRQTRCVVLVKGVPHRILDSDAGTVGDAPASFVGEYSAGDATAASVDSELALLWQDLAAGEAGGGGDSFADGQIRNPYWRQTRGINEFPRDALLVPKVLNRAGAGSPGLRWNFGNGPADTRLTAGDLVLTARLDGPSAAVVIASLDRAASVVYDPSSGVLVLDEADSNANADFGVNSELDNQGNQFVRDADDFEKTRDEVLADGRWSTALVRYDALAGQANFLVGPLLNYSSQGQLVSGPVVLLAHAGANHSGSKPSGPSGSAGDTFASSFVYADGAIFNTIESYNGRAFGSLGTIFGQEQIADFLAAGGTFGVGNVWEPFADTLADNRVLVQTFVLGELTWAEAAWSALPVVSWMQVVVGDPLARAVRASEDLNADSRVDIEDLYAWEQLRVDVNNDGVADDADRALVERAIRRTSFEDLGGRVR